MKRVAQSDYIKICICYRVFSIILATLVYFIFARHAEEISIKKILVAAGMWSACILGTFLYNKILEQEIKTIWIYIMVMIEVLAYGVFIYLSGGFYSPFLWYCIGCLFLPMSLNRCMPIVITAVCWYLICTIANRMVPSFQNEPINLEINTGIGVMIVIGGFYTLVTYIRKLNENQKKTEQALNHITDLYDSFHLFTMSDIDKIMEQLMGIIHRTIAPEGGLLIKFNEEGEPEWHQSAGITEDLISCMDDWEIAPIQKENNFSFKINNKNYDVLQLGNPPVYTGMLIRPQRESYASETEADSFHYGLIDIVFKNIDVQRQLETYIVGEEQKRIAHEIHDTVIQKLFGIACKLKVLESSLPDQQNTTLKTELLALKESVELAMKELRETIYGRRFMDHDKKFREKLKLYMDEVEKLWDTHITTDMDNDVESLSASQKLAIYKTTCEAVNNAIRHGDAKNVNVEIKIDNDGIHTIITDNGSGFTIGRTEKGIREGNGLKNMQRLAKAFKGKCMIESKPKKGTQVILYLPR